MTVRILVADDDPLMRTLMTIGLVDVAEVVEAADGTEVLQLLRDGRFDLLLLDWDMPGTNGLEVLRTIRQQGCQTPIIMVTGKNERVDVLNAIYAGVSDYLIKPFDIDTLYRKVQKGCASIPARNPPVSNHAPRASDKGVPHAEAAVLP
jgi:two-component system, chemotaxis family, chemotaxis protein CheY